MVAFCIISGVYESVSITNHFNQYLSNIEKVDSYVEKGKYDQAFTLCKSTAEDYKKITNNFIYCYYPHTNLDNIGVNLWVMTEELKNQEISKYRSLREETKKQLLIIKEEELFTIHNIL